MGKVTGAWERPIQGVSQQADKDRLDGQCTLQENLMPSPLDGLIKRTGTRHIKELSVTHDSKSLWYSYNRGDGESYLILIEPNKAPRVFDLDGTEHTVNANTPLSYISVANPKESLVLSTVADYTFIVNKDKTVERSVWNTPKNPNMAIVYCQYATYGRDYTINIDGVQVATYRTPDGSNASMVNQVRTNYVAERLASQFGGSTTITREFVTKSSPGFGLASEIELPVVPNSIISVTNKGTGLPVTNYRLVDKTMIFMRADVEIIVTVEVKYTVGAASSPYTAELHGNVLYITKNDNTPFEISTVDSADGNDLVAVQDRVQQISNLPPLAPDGYIVKVQRTVGYDKDAYWLKAEKKSGDATGSEVRWVETTAQESRNLFEKATMPHVLISEADGTFTFQQGEWEPREVGDDDTNPFPSFLGQKLTSVGVFQNRLIFTSGESAVFSRTNEFFNFFRETTQSALDSDPIDAYADTDEINNLVHHAVLDGDIIFFAENGQFLIQGNQPITRENIIFKKVTSYPINTIAPPAITGESIMFSFVAGKYAGIREMFTDSLTDTKRARPITEHVAEYIEGVPVDMVSSPNINTLLTRTDKSGNVLYVYDWLWAGDQKVQSAMHKWSIGTDVLFAKFIQDKVYFVIKRAEKLYLEQMPIGNDADDNGLDFPVALDRRKVVPAVYKSNRWEIDIPYPVEGEELVFVRGSNCWEEDRGTSVIFEKDGNKYVTSDDLGDINLVCFLTAGVTFESRYIPTKPYLKDYNGRTMGLDRFTLAKVQLNYESIGDVVVKVTDERTRRDWKYRYNGRRIGGWNNRVGFAPLESGRWEFPVRLESAYAQFEISTDDYRPFILRDMEWSGMFKQRGRRL